jgi:hypothetical protein
MCQRATQHAGIPRDVVMIEHSSSFLLFQGFAAASI